MSGDLAPNTIRVAHVVRDLHEGGLERLVVDLVRGADASRFSPYVICLRTLGQLATELSDERVQLVSASGGGALGMWRPQLLAAALQRLRVDIVHAHSGVWFKAARAAKLAGNIPLVFTDHGRQFPDSLSARILDHAASRMADRIVAVSIHLRDYLIRRLHIAAERTIVIQNAARDFIEPSNTEIEEARRSVGVSEGRLLVGSVGRLDRVKAYDVLIRGMSRVRADWSLGAAPHLVLIGDGPDRARLESVVREENMESHVTFAGWKRDPRALLSALDLFVLSSDSEGTSVSLLEAMQAKRAMVATAVGGTPDVLGNELVSQLVPPQDEQALAGAIRELLSDDRRRARVASLGHARVCAAFSQQTMINQYQSVYQDLAIR